LHGKLPLNFNQLKLLEIYLEIVELIIIFSIGKRSSLKILVINLDIFYMLWSIVDSGEINRKSF